MKKHIEGVLPALLVPTTSDGSTDVALLRRQVTYLLDAGAHGVFVNGSTAESPYMTTGEKVEVLCNVMEIVANRVPVYAAAIQPGTHQVLREVRELAAVGPDYLVVTAPFYYSLSQKAILEHYRRVAGEASIPVVAYNIPQSTHNDMTYESMVEISRIDGIVGMKDSSGDFARFNRVVQETRNTRFAWIQGDDFLDAASLMSGASAVVTGTGNIHLTPYIDLWEAHRNGDVDGVWGAQRHINGLCGVFCETSLPVIPAIKTATAMLGRSSFFFRQPGMEVDRTEHRTIRAVLTREGVLEA